MGSPVSVGRIAVCAGFPNPPPDYFTVFRPAGEHGQNNLPEMIRTEELNHHYGVKTALQGLNLQVSPGEVLGLLGPNGAGKSTTVKILTGLIRPTSGRAFVAGFDVVQQPLEAKHRLGYVPEQPALYDTLTAAEFL
jgi:ABC-2 type transport system ATP-binding protein